MTKHVGVNERLLVRPDLGRIFNFSIAGSPRNYAKLVALSDSVPPPPEMPGKGSPGDRNLIIEFAARNEWDAHVGAPWTAPSACNLNIDALQIGDILHSVATSVANSAKTADDLDGIRNLARKTCGAGGGPQLAWSAGEMLARGAVARRIGLAIIHDLAIDKSDDVTRTVIALLPDLYPQMAADLPAIRARALDPRSVVVTTTILRRAETALADVERLDINPAVARPAKALFGPALSDLVQWTHDPSPLVRFVSLGGAVMVLRATCRTVRRMPDPMSKAARLTYWVLSDTNQARRCRDGFASTKILAPLWQAFRHEMPRVAARMVRRAGPDVRQCLLASAVDALENGYGGRKQRSVPQFLHTLGRIEYVPPVRDPWPEFGKALASCANRDLTFRSALEATNARLQVWQIKAPSATAESARSPRKITRSGETVQGDQSRGQLLNVTDGGVC